MKKWMSILLLFTMLLGVFTACSSSTSSDKATVNSTSTGSEKAAVSNGDKAVTIRFMHQWAEKNRLPYWQNLVKSYMEQNPNVKIDMQVIPNEPYKDKLRVILGGNDVPDLFFTWDGDYVARLAKANAIQDLNPLLDKDPEFKNAFNQSLLTTGQYNGGQYGLPVRTCVNFFLYNTKIFKQYNLGEPKTWDEFLKICDTLKSNNITPLALGNAEAWPLLHYISALNLRLVPQDTFNADYYLQKGEFTDPGYVRALQTMVDLNDKGYIMQGANSTAFAAAREIFTSEKVAMIQDQVASFKSFYADNMDSAAWGIFPMPEFSDSKGSTDMLVGWIDQFVISKNCKNTDAVINFLKFFYNEKNQKQMQQELGFVSTINSVSAEKNSVPQINEAMDIINKAKGFTATIDLEMNASVAAVYSADVQELFTGKKPNEIMADVQKEAARVMKEGS